MTPITDFKPYTLKNGNKASFRRVGAYCEISIDEYDFVRLWDIMPPGLSPAVDSTSEVISRDCFTDSDGSHKYRLLIKTKVEGWAAQTVYTVTDAKYAVNANLSLNLLKGGSIEIKGVKLTVPADGAYNIQLSFTPEEGFPDIKINGASLKR